MFADNSFSLFGLGVLHAGPTASECLTELIRLIVTPLQQSGCTLTFCCH